MLCTLLGLSNYAKFIVQFAPTPTPLLIKFDLPPTTEIAHYVIKRDENSAHPVNKPRWLQTWGVGYFINWRWGLVVVWRPAGLRVGPNS